MKKIDYYSYWNKKRAQSSIYDREKIVLNLLQNLIKNDCSFLDVGCGNGRFMEIILSKFGNFNLRAKGIDYSIAEVNEAENRGLDVKQGDVEKNIDFRKESFDIVYAGEVIEHLYNPDNFLYEINRITKKGGYLILTTPNLCAWFNRFLMLFGIQPLFIELSTKSKKVGAGILKKLKQESQPVGHIRIFTIAALKDILKMNGFKIVQIKGSIFDTGIPKSLLWIDRIFKVFPSLSSNLIIVAKKV